MRTEKETIRSYDEQASTYDKVYYGENPEVKVNLIRVNMFIDLLKKDAKYKKVVDAGSGSGAPTLLFLKEGLEAKGFDYSPEMVEVSKKNLVKAGHDTKLIVEANLEKEVPFQNEEFDAMMMHGPLMHCTNEKNLLDNAAKMLKKGGLLFCEARNELMSAFSMNEYTQKFFLKLVEAETLPEPLKSEVIGFYSKFQGVNSTAPWKANFITRLYNPFTIHELFEASGFKIKKLHFAHFHCLPPRFEKKYPELYEKLSRSIEYPEDWRGYLMASTFMVEAYKE